MISNQNESICVKNIVLQHINTDRKGQLKFPLYVSYTSKHTDYAKQLNIEKVVFSTTLA